MSLLTRLLPWLQTPADRRVSADCLSERRRTEFSQGYVVGVSWRWPFRRHLDYNGPRNRRLLRNDP